MDDQMTELENAPGSHLPDRRGNRPQTSPRTPHVQLDQFGPEPVHAELWRRMTELPHTVSGPSLVSVPSSRALQLVPDHARGPAHAFMIGNEFAHFHGDGSGSLHLTLPLDLADRVTAAGWGELHPMARLGVAPHTFLMVFGPRDNDELEVVWGLVLTSYHFAVGNPV
jgi:hypothetical protein